nr:hypothetical protein [Tanacetum cinerariifolium]
MAETMEQYMSKTRADNGSGVARLKIKDVDSFELKGQFLKELRSNTFSSSDQEDANEHIEKVLEIEDLKTKFLSKYCPSARTAKKMEEINNFQQKLDETLYQACEQFKELLMKCPQHYLMDMLEVIMFYNGLEVPTRQILDSKGAIPSKTAVDAKVAIQEMAEYSQKLHNETYRTRSTKTSDGLVAIQAQLNNLGRDLKKVYAAQVRCKQCKGPYYTNDFPLKEEDKLVYKGNNVIVALINVPIFVGTFFVVMDFKVLEDMDAYRDEGMGDVIVEEPFLKEIRIKARRFNGMITIYNGNDEVTYQMEDTAYMCLHSPKDHEGNKINTSSCLDVITFACVILSLSLEDLGAYDFGFATRRALVYAGEMTSGDDRSCNWVSLTHELTNIIVDVFEYHFQVKLMIIRAEQLPHHEEEGRVDGIVEDVVELEVDLVIKAVQIAGTLTDEAIRNGSIKKNHEKRGNSGEPSNDRNERDDNKRTKTGNDFATTTKLIRRENTSSEARGNHQNQVVAINEGQGCGNNSNQECGMSFMLGANEARQDPYIVIATFTLNNHYATTLFNSGANYSFISTTFAPVLGIEPSDLGFSYEIEIDSRQLIEIDKAIKGYKIEIEGHEFDINLIPFGSRSFDVIIRMDWLSIHKAEIIYHEKVVRIPLLDGKMLRVLGERPKKKERHLMSEKEHKRE